MNLVTKTGREFPLQLSYECLLFARHAVKSCSKSRNTDVSMLFMNEASQCAKIAQDFYMHNYLNGSIFNFEQFFHQFDLLNIEFLTSIETNRGLEQSLNKLEDLEEVYNELKIVVEKKTML